MYNLFSFYRKNSFVVNGIALLVVVVGFSLADALIDGHGIKNNPFLNRLIVGTGSSGSSGSSSGSTSTCCPDDTSLECWPFKNKKRYIRKPTDKDCGSYKLVGYVVPCGTPRFYIIIGKEWACEDVGEGNGVIENCMNVCVEDPSRSFYLPPYD